MHAIHSQNEARKPSPSRQKALKTMLHLYLALETVSGHSIARYRDSRIADKLAVAYTKGLSDVKVYSNDARSEHLERESRFSQKCETNRHYLDSTFVSADRRDPSRYLKVFVRASPLNSPLRKTLIPRGHKFLVVLAATPVRTQPGSTTSPSTITSIT